MLAKSDAHHERMTRMDSQLQKIKAMVDVFEERLNKMNTMNLEANQKKLEAIVEQQEVPREETVVQTIRTLVDRYGDWHLAIGQHQQPKRRTHNDGGSWQKLATA
jgi:hypothetical protein